MARLRNRMVKADFWTDPELLRWPRDKRQTYRGLWALAEDSGCLEDDPFGWKLLLWPSPMDEDITIALLETWRDEMVATGKLIPYQADGKRYFFLRTFHQHEHPRNPQSPDLPLPPWVTYQSRQVERKDTGRGGTYTINEYVLDLDLIPSQPNHTVTVAQPYGNRTETPVLSCPVLSSPVLNHIPVGVAETATDVDEFADIDFGDANPDQEKPSGNGSRPKSDTEPPNAGTMVAYLVDYAREIGFTMTGSKKGHFAKAIGDIWKAGVDPTVMQEAIRQSLENNKSPAHLVDVVNDLKGGARAKTRRDDGRSQHGEWE
ncbi:MAG: hypothetical protein JW990_00210 [Thermoleophilia bacterium]|nr:hypothetical protein [Thermoleophilia bacterium]